MSPALARHALDMVARGVVVALTLPWRLPSIALALGGLAADRMRFRSMCATVARVALARCERWRRAVVAQRQQRGAILG